MLMNFLCGHLDIVAPSLRAFGGHTPFIKKNFWRAWTVSIHFSSLSFSTSQYSKSSNVIQKNSLSIGLIPFFFKTWLESSVLSRISSLVRSEDPMEQISK